jgi:hypothetical protein
LALDIESQTINGVRIFIDFEGNRDEHPVILGVLEHSSGQPVFTQWILDPLFQPLAEHNERLRAGSLTDVLTRIDREHGVSSSVYAWSTHEQQVITGAELPADLLASWSDRVIDAKVVAKRWARIAHPEFKPARIAGRGRHTLDQYLDLANYAVPRMHGAGNTGSRLRSLRTALEKGKTFSQLTSVQKAKWTNLLEHNRHDCFGMARLVELAERH